MAVERTQWSGKLVVVTGAAHGIGRATALRLAQLGARLELFDVDAQALEKTSRDARESGAISVVSRTVDVSNAAAVQAAARAVHEYVEAVDVLINNAGVGVVGEVLDTRLEDFEWLLGVNLWGVIHGVRAFVPAMRARGRGGHVINVASAAGYFAAAGLGAYAATKHAVLGLSEALREELRPAGIGVTVVCPTVVSTEMARRLRIRGSEEPLQARARLERISAGGTSPDRVAEAIVHILGRNPALVPVSAEAKALYLLKRFFPSVAPYLVRRVVRYRTAREGTHDVG
jgi:short-subunit dehydrogenase